jgi:hypothetical protein
MDLPLLDMERRLGVKDSEIDDFLSKVTAVDEAIRGLKVRAAWSCQWQRSSTLSSVAALPLIFCQDGKIDPRTDIKIPGIKTEDELRREAVRGGPPSPSGVVRTFLS